MKLRQFVKNEVIVPERQTLFGKTHLVAPVVMMVEGVHCGSSGCLYYTPEFLSQNPDAWNGTPLIAKMHPDGSANQPQTLEQMSIGYLFGVNFSEEKLRGQIWIDEERAKKIYPELLDSLATSKPIEISLSAWYDSDGKSGTWNNEKYDGTAIGTIVPDHFAVSVDFEGACSHDDGCGVRSNQDDTFLTKVTSTIKETLTNLFKQEDTGMDKTKFIADLIANEKTQFTDDDKEWLSKLEDAQLEKLCPCKNEETVTTNEDATASEHTVTTVWTDITTNDNEPTNDEYIKQLPAELQATLNRALEADRKKKAELVKALLANKNNSFTEDQLNAKDVTELEQLTALARVDVDYSGSAGNTENTSKVEPLPVVDFVEAAKKRRAGNA